jgi:hypothetical protein
MRLTAAPADHPGRVYRLPDRPPEKPIRSQNQLNQVAVIALDPTLSTGRVVTRVTDSDFSVPTTIDELGSRLYAVNAHFGQPNPDTLPYEVVRLRKP